MFFFFIIASCIFFCFFLSSSACLIFLASSSAFLRASASCSLFSCSSCRFCSSSIFFLASTSRLNCSAFCASSLFFFRSAFCAAFRAFLSAICFAFSSFARCSRSCFSRSAFSSLSLSSSFARCSRSILSISAFRNLIRVASSSCFFFSFSAFIVSAYRKYIAAAICSQFLPNLDFGQLHLSLTGLSFFKATTTSCIFCPCTFAFIISCVLLLISTLFSLYILSAASRTDLSNIFIHCCMILRSFIKPSCINCCKLIISI